MDLSVILFSLIQSQLIFSEF